MRACSGLVGRRVGRGGEHPEAEARVGKERRCCVTASSRATTHASSGEAVERSVRPHGSGSWRVRAKVGTRDVQAV